MANSFFSGLQCFIASLLMRGTNMVNRAEVLPNQKVMGKQFIHMHSELPILELAQIRWELVELVTDEKRAVEKILPSFRT